MELFVSEFVLDVIYHEYVETVRGVYVERQNQAETAIESDIIPFFKMLKSTLEKVAAGDKTLVLEMFDSLECDLMDRLREFNSMMSR